ncbi:MAG: hypothetical protein M1442_00155 [Candidatus Thermoplasmatota archaeon]|jgi:hypothetical protein|nr:hypothetical protein [Candidatus Thermoplasmatota archaeon]
MAERFDENGDAQSPGTGKAAIAHAAYLPQGRQTGAAGSTQYSAPFSFLKRFIACGIPIGHIEVNIDVNVGANIDDNIVIYIDAYIYELLNDRKQCRRQESQPVTGGTPVS